ncbi:hypothetical protein NDN08_007541 [Rhodosorus marinus]|uniref:lycopene beta-cyclase n=1 Tax=Rhodosorus marinus TaxID=101924 RepID=A0AAV8UXV7_9RHOD|nr:hypothetical protein NDN08_007541 [Rhodosorus marinus]
MGFVSILGLPNLRARQLSLRRAVARTSAEQEVAKKGAVESVDVAIIGGGPAGLSLARAVSERGASVLVIEKDVEKKWPNNYGVWMDELARVSLDDCVKKSWPVATVYTGEGEKRVLERPYGRVDVEKMKQKIRAQCQATGKVTVSSGLASSVEHKETSSIMTFKANGEKDSSQVEAKAIVDATGHALGFVEFTEGHAPGIQAAYGMEITVPSHPWPVGEMLLMDFRAEHMKGSDKEKKDADEVPLFFYVMPMSDTRIFVEETSLIGKPAVGFDYLKEQCYKRLAYHNVQVDEVHEEEFCFIPMGGGMPLLNQRVIGYGGSAGLVHPATGYMFGNAVNRVDEVGEALVNALNEGSLSGDEVSKRVWKQIWSDARLLQRDFLVFGGETILRMKLHELQYFFAAFFKLPWEQWTEFLSFGLIRPEERLVFGLGVFLRTSNAVRFKLVFEAITRGQLTLLNSVIPNPFRRN